ncbi:MAG: putative Ig domain-containing protein, partial [Actinomycetota bacterium]|nr:putative Ig domain-containing protein [Actinomycetota bacterium]
ADGGKILAVLDDGTILFSYLALDSTFRLVRLTPDGAIDPLFFSASTPVSTVPSTFLVIDPATGVSVNVPGIFGSTSSTAGFSDAFVLAGGKVIVVGGFDTYRGNPAHGIVRLNANGTVDTSFQTGGGAQWTQTTETTTFHPSIDNIELENDGKFLITGTFEAYNGAAAPGIASLNPDGTLFESLWRIASRAKFDTYGSRAILARQPDGSFLLSGPFALPGQTEEPSFIHINSVGDVPIVGSPLIANGVGGQAFTYQIVASGQPTSYSATGLPDGLAIDPLTGLISGTSTVGGTFLVTLNATNGSGTGTAILTINLAPIIISPLTASGTVSLPFSYQFEASGATSLAVDASTLPPGLTFDPTLRAIVGNPTVEGTFQVGLSATNSGGTTSATLTLTVQPLPAAGPVIMNVTSVTGRTGSPFSFQVITSGGSSLARVSATDLPAGLSIDSVTGEISGTVTTDGSFSVALSVIDAGMTNTSTLQLTFTSDPVVPVIVSPNRALLFPGLPFSYTILAPTSDPTDPVTYSEIGPLPPGLSLDKLKGIISGTFHFSFGLQPTPALAGGVVTNVQLFACNSSGCSAQGLFFLLPAGAANISTRLSVGTVENVLIGGFITEGNAPMKLIVRGIGPSLPLGGPLANPYLELHSGPDTLASNDNWKDNLAGGSQEVAIQNTGLAPTDNLESAILSVLDPGSYTAIMNGTNNGTGVGLVEVYNLGAASMDVSSEAQLANISTRGLVQTDANVMIGGFINQGSVPIKVLVRGIGPSLTQFGVTGALANPTLDLHKPDGTVVSNDDWTTDPAQKTAITATGLAPKNELESAILVTLPVGEGLYTAIVSGVDGTTGVGLVEAYFGNPCLGTSCP